MKSKLTLLLAGILCLTACSGNPSSSDSSSSGEEHTSSSETTNSSESTESSESSESETKTETEEVEKFAVKNIAEKIQLTKFRKNKGETSKFLDKSAIYQVGDDNAFNFKPVITVISSKTHDEKVDPNWKITMELSILENDEYVLLGDRTNDYIEGFDDVKAEIDFKEAAIGHKFKIKYAPEKLAPSQQNNVNFYKTLEVEVLDGYNVYNVNELAYIDNDNFNLGHNGFFDFHYNQKTIWDNFKTAHELKLDYAPAGIFLHDDMQITTDNIPAEFLINDAMVKKLEGQVENPNDYKGLLLDFVNIYSRKLAANEKFVFNGNYFTVDASKLPVIGLTNNNLKKAGQAQISHSQLFFFTGDKTAAFDIRNYKAIGNAGKLEDQMLAGGLIMFKDEHTTFHLYNNIAVSWFITYFAQYTGLAEDDTREIVYEKCVATDAYNCFVYNWGSHIILKECDFYGAGGPCIIQDHLSPKDNPTNELKMPKTIAIDCNMHSFVAGTEGWFDSMGATAIVPSVKAMDGIFNQLGRSFIYKNNKIGSTGEETEVQMFDMIVLNKSSEAEGPTAEPKTRGTFEVRNTKEETSANNYTYNYFKNDPIRTAIYTQGLANSTIPPFFETNGGGASFFDGTTLRTLTLPSAQGQLPGELASNQAELAKMVSGSQFALYYNGMMIILSLGSIGQSVPAK